MILFCKNSMEASVYISLKNLTAALLLAASTQAQAVTVAWADWTGTTAGAANHVDGVINDGLNSVNVDFDGIYSFVQTSGGTNYWTEPNALDRPYTGGVVGNAPPASDIIALAQGGAKRISFDQAVTDVYIAFTSWNGNTVLFDAPFTVISDGPGFWGNGSFVVNGTGDGFFGAGEVHGILKFSGTFTEINFTDTSENWHGLTVGIERVGGTVPTPEPAMIGLLGLGLGALAYGRRRCCKV